MFVHLETIIFPNKEKLIKEKMPSAYIAHSLNPGDICMHGDKTKKPLSDWEPGGWWIERAKQDTVRSHTKEPQELINESCGRDTVLYKVSVKPEYTP